MKDIEWYTEFIINEMLVYKETEFIGNVTFKLNYYNGKITNLVAEQHKSIKMQGGEDGVRS